MDGTIEPEDIRELALELKNFQEIVAHLRPSPGEIPRLDGIEIDGVSLPLRGAVGGDHVIYIDFARRYDLAGLQARAAAAGRPEVVARLESSRHCAGILLADVAGHQVTDALVAAMLHQAFLLGTYYEMEFFGQITTKLLENIKTRFYESTNIRKLVAMLYGEITDSGRFRYFSAGHPPPLVFSREFGQIMPLDADRTVSETPIGLFPARLAPGQPRFGVDRADREEHVVNEIELLGSGDILLLATDGLIEHGDGRFVEEALTPCLEAAKDFAVGDICSALRDAVLAFAPPADDITFVVVKRT